MPLQVSNKIEVYHFCTNFFLFNDAKITAIRLNKIYVCCKKIQNTEDRRLETEIRAILADL